MDMDNSHDAWQIIFSDGSVYVPTDSDPRNPRASWIYAESTANELVKTVRHPITGGRGVVVHLKSVR